MPQPAGVFGSFPCEQPIVQPKQDARRLVAAATAAGPFHELITHLIIEHERVLERNNELRAENSRLQRTGAPRGPPTAPAPWDAGTSGVAEELSVPEAPDMPCFPVSTAGRPVLASERQLLLDEPSELHGWLAAVEASPGAATAPGRCCANARPPAGDWAFRGPLDDSSKIDAGTQTRDGDELEEEEEDEESVVGEDNPEVILQGGTCEAVAKESDLDLGKAFEERPESSPWPDEEQKSGAEKKKAFKRSESSVSTSSATVRRYSSNGRLLNKPEMAMYLLLEDSESSRGAWWYKMTMQTLLFVSVATPLLQFVDPPVISGVAAALIETAFDVLFTVELLARVFVNPAPRMFFCKVCNLLDLIIPAALTLRAAVGFAIPLEEPLGAPAVILLCFIPIVRLLKMLRRWGTIHLLAKAFSDVLEALPVLLFPLLVITLLFATLIYIAEPRDNISSFATAVWLTIVTMTTVGYGDVTPTSAPGSCIVGILVITSVMYMAMPVAILGSSFTTVWQDRDTVMLMHRAKERLLQWGYSVHDIPVLFQVFDRDCSGDLNEKEFVRMIKTMKLGLSDEQVMSLFRTFDSDGSGEVDDKEFVRVLFPHKYLEVFGASDDGDIDEPIFAMNV